MPFEANWGISEKNQFVKISLFLPEMINYSRQLLQELKMADNIPL